jgi:hypothetical protein
MKLRFISFSAVLCVSALLASESANAQVRSQKVNATASANLASETILQGTILKYTPNSSVAPLGAHITVQTSSGPVDVHIGNEQFLKLNNFNIAEGNAIKLSGHSKLVGTNTVFFARLLSQGNQTLAVRSESGMPLWRGGVGGRRSAASANQKAGAR